MVDLPDPAEREAIFRIHFERRRRPASGFRLPELVEASQGFSGAEIEQAIISALFDAFAENGELTTDHVLEALRQTVPLSRTMDEKLAQLRAWADGRARHASLARRPAV